MEMQRTMQLKTNIFVQCLCMHAVKVWLYLGRQLLNSKRVLLAVNHHEFVVCYKSIIVKSYYSVRLLPWYDHLDWVPPLLPA